MSQHELSLAEGAIELESPRYSSEAATEVATVVAVLNVPKLAEVLSPPPRPVATREDCAVVAVVWVVPLATDARTGSCGGQCYDRGGFPGDTLDRVRKYGVNAQELVTTSSTRLLMTT